MRDKDTDNKMLVTPAEACQLIGVGRTTMYSWIKNETIPVVRFPNCRNIYIRKEDLHQLIKDNIVSNEDSVSSE